MRASGGIRWSALFGLGRYENGRCRVLIVSILIVALMLAAASIVVDARADLKEAEAEARFPPEGQLIDVDGRTAHVVVEGSGPDLVLIHGASGNTRDFTFSLSKELAQNYRVFTIDRPGLGWTDRVSDAFGGAFNTRAESPGEQAAFLARAAQQMGVEAPLVLGHSYGGAVALAWALDQPAAGIVVLSGATMPWPGGLGPLYRINASALGGSQFVPLLTAFAPENRVSETLATIFEPQCPPEGYQRYVGVGLSLRREALRANARQVNSLKPHVAEMSAQYGDIALPVEVVHGTADTIVPAEIHAVPLSRTLPNAELTLLDGIGHMPHHVAIPDVIAAIDRAATRAGLR